MPQIAAPVSDTYTGDGWTTESENSSNLYQTIDEASASDADYVRSPSGPDGDAYVVKLANVTDPLSNNSHVVSYRFGKDATGGDLLSLLVELRQDYVDEQNLGTLIAFKTESNVSAGWSDGTLSLLPQEIDLISDFTNLYLRFVATNVAAPVITTATDGTAARPSIVEKTTAIITLTADNPNPFGTIEWTITQEFPDYSLFQIDINSGALSFINPPNYDIPLDFDGEYGGYTWRTDNSYWIKVRATIAGTNQYSEISVNTVVTDDGLTVPTINPSQTFNVDEDVAVSTVVGELILSNPAAILTGAAITAGNTNTAFSISVVNNKAQIAVAAQLNYATLALYNLTCTVTTAVGTSPGRNVLINVNEVVSTLGPELWGNKDMDSAGVGGLSNVGSSFTFDSTGCIVSGGYSNLTTGNNDVIEAGKNYRYTINLDYFTSGVLQVAWDGASQSWHSITTAGTITFDRVAQGTQCYIWSDNAFCKINSYSIKEILSTEGGGGGPVTPPVGAATAADYAAFKAAFLPNAPYNFEAGEVFDNVVGDTFKMDVLTQTQVSAAQETSHRFRCVYGGTLDWLRVYFIGGPVGYSGGNGGTIRMRIYADDGNGLPDTNGTLYGEASSIMGINPPATVTPAIRNLFITSYVPLVTNNLYHVVYDQIDANPSTNWASVESLTTYGDNLPTTEVFKESDFQTLIKPAGGSWTVRHNTYAALTPILGIYTSGGVFGCGSYSPANYDSGGSNYLFTFTNSSPIRVKIVPTSTRVWRGAAITLITSTGGSLDWTLKTAAGITLQSGSIYEAVPNDVVTAQVSFVREFDDYYPIYFGSNGEGLTNGQTYYLELVPQGATQWRAAVQSDGRDFSYVGTTHTEITAQHYYNGSYIGAIPNAHTVNGNHGSWRGYFITEPDINLGPNAAALQTDVDTNFISQYSSWIGNNPNNPDLGTPHAPEMTVANIYNRIPAAAGLVSAFNATKDSKYLQILIDEADRQIDDARSIAGNNPAYKTYWAGPYNVNNYHHDHYEWMGAMWLGYALLALIDNPAHALSTTANKTKIAEFLRDHCYEKWKGGVISGESNITTDSIYMRSRAGLWMIALDQYYGGSTYSDWLANYGAAIINRIRSDTTGYNENGAVVPANFQSLINGGDQPGTTISGTTDVSHGNKVPAFVIEAHERGYSWVREYDVLCLAKAMNTVMWKGNGFSDVVDGRGGVNTGYYGKKVYEWLMLCKYDNTNLPAIVSWAFANIYDTNIPREGRGATFAHLLNAGG